MTFCFCPREPPRYERSAWARAPSIQRRGNGFRHVPLKRGGRRGFGQGVGVSPGLRDLFLGDLCSVCGWEGRGGAGCPLIAAVAIGLVMVFVAVKFSWRLVLSKLRFCIVFHPECLQIGRGLAKCLIPYDDVETISLPLRNERGSWIKVGCRKYKAQVILDPEEIRGCLSWLRQYSANAIVVDENGRERLPPTHANADRCLDAMEQYFRRKAGVLVWAGFFFGCLFVGQIGR